MLEDLFLTKHTLNALITELSKPENIHSVKGIKRGIEREALRISNKRLSQKTHPKALGSALTNRFITTDFSEALLEFITPAESDINKTMGQLFDIHKFTTSHMEQELLWPMSMPCFIKKQDDIALAQYGSSNIGKMKTLYREGLKNRYGSMMQAIAGIHFNLSFPQNLWQKLEQLAVFDGTGQSAISQGYLGLIRNFKRELWLLTYLFGASPALCNSFLEGQETKLPFEKIGKGTLYLPYATALRMGDLGYTNSAQSSLRVTYNSLEEYISGLKQAISTESNLYRDLGCFLDEPAKQLNQNILQIENEFYSPIRPKRNASEGETPTQALQAGGIEYIEVRVLDVNPFSAVGISEQQIRFLDVFLLYCLLKPSYSLSWQAQLESQANLDLVVNQGREPGLELSELGKPRQLKAWAKTIFDDLQAIAKLLDSADQGEHYQSHIAELAKAIDDPNLTLSGRYLNALKNAELDNGELALEYARAYQDAFEAHQYAFIDEAQLNEEALQSRLKQQQIEQSDERDFKQFLTDYFKQ